MRGISIATIAVLALGVTACGQTKAEAEADLAAKNEGATPRPADPGDIYVGEAPPTPLADLAAPATAADAAADPEAAAEAEADTEAEAAPSN
ncbi:hypothetical protein GCM10007973_30370 [Polymorphobacter multimanifer]|uniref:Lipoprotein n=2 Tax=Polymorphobacter multimanifer TaxID=1070431 RepID=A0A841L5N3_9SPHN|nr:hypothetical protein [Polymorphobacter multimanifer]MBB6228219.1 hypothetical protein [Polymorphobacter multimanifer]GGI92099.1 hypothetical protein GCM10007973_30370 [Polymorphobacter multimanifer]